MKSPQWHRFKTKPESFVLQIGKEQLATVTTNHVGGWWYTAQNETFQIPFTSTLDELPGFTSLNSAKRAAFNYITKHFKHDKRIF